MMDEPAFVLTRRPTVRMDQGALTFMERSAIDTVLAERQHAIYRNAVTYTGVTLIDAPSDDRFPDSTFVEDVLLALPECFILCRPGTPSRENEPDLIISHLPNDRPMIRIEAPATLDGGDVLRIDREIFVGLSSRTNEAAVIMLREFLAEHNYTVSAVQMSGSLHLKTAITAVTSDMLVANRAWVDVAPFGNRRIIDVDPSESFAGNTLRVGSRLYMQTAHCLTAERLRDAGLSVDLLDISEFAKSEAGLTCMSVLIPPRC